jgi:hypothetical protein
MRFLRHFLTLPIDLSFSVNSIVATSDETSFQSFSVPVHHGAALSEQGTRTCCDLTPNRGELNHLFPLAASTETSVSKSEGRQHALLESPLPSAHESPIHAHREDLVWPLS